MRAMHPTLGLLLAVMLIGTPTAARGQQSAGPGDPRTYGTVSEVIHTIQATSFVGFTTTATYQVNGVLAQFCTGTTSCALNSGLMLPAGAVITKIQLDACDETTAGQVTATLFKLPVNEGGGGGIIATALTGFTQDPDCDLFDGPLGVAETVNNATNAYAVSVSIGSSVPLSGTLRFQAVRVFYKLKTSPAPATATFNDVPTGHPFFSFVEALVAAGITSGCSVSPPLFCPDNPVTRGQLAKFLGQALGLHFAP